VPHAVRQLNARIITHLKYSPVEILMGIPPAPPTSPSLPPPPPRDFEVAYQALTDPYLSAQFVSAHVVQQAQLRELTLIQSDKRKDYEASRYGRSSSTRPPFSPGDLIMLYQDNTGKLEPRWRGPFKIDGFGGTHGISYKIVQLNGRKIRGTFHLDDLKLLPERPLHLRFGDEEEYQQQQTIRRSRKAAKRPA
jgi:hypothetical protein